MSKVRETIDKITGIYHDNDVCLDELLDSVRLSELDTDLSINELVRAYGTVRKTIDGDVVLRVNADDSVFESVEEEV